MALGRAKSGEKLGLRAGDVVEVKSKEEILRTLDELGALDKLPFMPEMLAFCGQQFTVTASAHRTCDTITEGPKKQRRFLNTVHLDNTRCSGAAHGGCQAQCTLFWKEAWLKRVPKRSAAQAQPSGGGRPNVGAVCTEASLQAATVRDNSGLDPIYRCQATEHVRASEPFGTWNLLQYWRDVRSRNVTPLTMIRGVAWWVARLARTHLPGYRLQIRLFNAIQHLRGGNPLMSLAGERTKTPREQLNLSVGERVKVKDVDEIKATLDSSQRNRGLYFDIEMTPFCNHTFPVLSRVNRIIDERTGAMREIPGDCILLDGVACTGKYHLSCPRAILPYWREIWLSREQGRSATPKDEGAAAGRI